MEAGDNLEPNLGKRLRRCRSAGEIDRVLSAESIPDLATRETVEVLVALIDLVQRLTSDQQGESAGRYLHVAFPLGICQMVRNWTRGTEPIDDDDAILQHAFDTYKEAYFLWLSGANSELRAAGALALGWVTNLHTNDLERLASIATRESASDALSAQLLVLGLRGHEQLLSLSEYNIASQAIDSVLLQACSSGAFALAKGRADRKALESLIAATGTEERMPSSWGELGSNDVMVSNLALSLLAGVRVDRQPELALKVVGMGSTHHEANAALNLCLGPLAWPDSLGPVWSEMDNSQRNVFQQCLKIQGVDFHSLGIYHLHAVRFLEERSFPWRVMVVRSGDGDRFVSTPALLRGTMLGQFTATSVAESFITHGEPLLVLQALLKGPEWLRVILRLYPRIIEKRRLLLALESLLLQLSGAGYTQQIAAELSQLNRRALDHCALVVHGHLSAHGCCVPGSNRWSRALRADRIDVLERAVSRLPLQCQEELIIESGSFTYAPLALTLKVATWVLENTIEENADDALEVLRQGDAEVLKELATASLSSEAAHLVRDLVLEENGI